MTKNFHFHANILIISKCILVEDIVRVYLVIINIIVFVSSKFKDLIFQKIIKKLIIKNYHNRIN